MTDVASADRFAVGACTAGLFVGAVGVAGATATDAAAVTYFGSLLGCFVACLGVPFGALFDRVRVGAPAAAVPLVAHAAAETSWGAALVGPARPVVFGAAAAALGVAVAALSALTVRAAVPTRRPPAPEPFDESGR